MSRISRLVAASLAAVALVVPAAAQPTAPETTSGPIAVVAVSSVDHLLGDVNFIGSLGGQPQLAGQIQPMVVGFTQGLDRTRPAGLVVNSSDMGPGGALAIPVTDLKMLLQTVQPFGVETKEENGVIEINIPSQGQTLFAKDGGQWAFLSMMPHMLEGMPADPASLLAELTNEYDLGVRLHVQNIPEAFRQMAIQNLQAGMDAGMQKQPGETDEQYEARKEVTATQIDQLKRMISEIDVITFGLGVDGEGQRAFFEFVYSAVAGTQLAEQMALNSDPTTKYSGFFNPDAAVTFSIASKISETDAAQVDQMYGAMLKQAYASIDEDADDLTEAQREVVKSAMADLMGSLTATLKAGKLDMGANAVASPDSLTIVGGGYNADPAKVESGLKKLAGVAEEKHPGKATVKWNADSHGDVNFHTISMPVPEGQKEPRQMFGETLEMAVGIGSDSVYFCLGRDCLAAAKQAIDDSKSAGEKSVPPMEMSVSVGQIMQVVAAFANESEKPQAEMIANMLANEALGRDHVRLSVTAVENGVRSRFEAEEGVLRAIGMAAMQAQMQQAEGGGF